MPEPPLTPQTTLSMAPSLPLLTAPRRTVPVLLASLLILATPFAAPAQSNDSSASAPAATPAPVKLDPFVVTNDDSGYQATTSVVATGFNRDVEHTPLVINVITEDFIRDAGLDSYEDIAQFMPNTYVVPDPVGLGSTANARGQGTSYYSQDGVRYYTEPIVRTGARVEVIKGPATLFFGRAQPGGIFNFSTRQPSAINEQTLTLTYGTFDKKVLDVGSQGKIDQKGNLTYRLDGSYQDNGSFIDYGYDKLKFIRAALSYKISDTLRLNLKGEYSYRDQSGNPIGSTVIAPQYYADYKNPRPEQLTWARAYFHAPGATDAQAADALRSLWKENLAYWIIATQQAYINDPNNKDGVYPTWATGVSGTLTPHGWGYNASALGTYARKKVTTWGGDVLWTPNHHVAIKASYTKYDLKRPRLNVQLTEILADGKMRAANMQVREDQNDSETASLSALFDYELGPTHHTTNIGAQYFRDFYRNINGVMYGLNQAPGYETRDPRTSGGGITAAGYDPQTDPYLDMTKFVKQYPDQVTPPAWAENYENAVYFSHIAEFFDRKLGLLLGGRIQQYEVRNLHFKNTAGLDDINTLGLSWNVTPDLVFFASRSKSFEPNINVFLVDGPGATQAEKDANVHPPVTGLGYDVGFKFGLFHRKLTGQISAFQVSRLNDAAFRVGDLARNTADPRNNDADPNNNVTWYVPGGERLSRGADVELTWQPNKQYAAMFTAGWLPVSKVVQNDAIPFITTIDGRKIRDPNQANYVGQRNPNSPEYTLSFWNHYKVAGTPWGFGIGGNYVSEVEIPNLSSYHVTVPSYYTLRAGVDYTRKLNKGELRLSLVIANLLNERYFVSFYRGEPFNATVKAAYQF